MVADVIVDCFSVDRPHSFEGFFRLWLSGIISARVTVLQADKAVLFESQVIVEYLDEITPGSLHPRGPLEKARHRAWIEFGSQTLNAVAAFYSAKDMAAFNEKTATLRGCFERIEPEIAGPYFAGSEFHIIDGVWGTIFRYIDVFEEIGKFGFLKAAPKAGVWRDHIMSRSSVQNAAPSNYRQRLKRFIADRGAHLSTLL